MNIIATLKCTTKLSVRIKTYNFTAGTNLGAVQLQFAFLVVIRGELFEQRWSASSASVAVATETVHYLLLTVHTTSI